MVKFWGHLESKVQPDAYYLAGLLSTYHSLWPLLARENGHAQNHIASHTAATQQYLNH